MYVLSPIFPPMFFAGMLPTVKNCSVAFRYKWLVTDESGSSYGTWPTCTLNEAEMYTPPETAKIWFVCTEQALHKDSFILVCGPFYVSVTNSHTVSNNMSNYNVFNVVNSITFQVYQIFFQRHLCCHKLQCRFNWQTNQSTLAWSAKNVAGYSSIDILKYILSFKLPFIKS